MEQEKTGHLFEQQMSCLALCHLTSQIHPFHSPRNKASSPHAVHAFIAIIGLIAASNAQCHHPTVVPT